MKVGTEQRLGENNRPEGGSSLCMSIKKTNQKTCGGLLVVEEEPTRVLSLSVSLSCSLAHSLPSQILIKYDGSQCQWCETYQTNSSKHSIVLSDWPVVLFVCVLDLSLSMH